MLADAHAPRLPQANGTWHSGLSQCHHWKSEEVSPLFLLPNYPLSSLFPLPSVPALPLLADVRISCLAPQLVLLLKHLNIYGEILAFSWWSPVCLKVALCGLHAVVQISRLSPELGFLYTTFRSSIGTTCSTPRTPSAAAPCC